MNTQSTVTYTLRLPEDLKARLERSASNRNKSLNQLVLDIIEEYYRAAGFAQGTRLTASGRVLEVRIKDTKSHAPGLPFCIFYLDDPSREREVAAYSFGLTHQAMSRLEVEPRDQYKVIEEMGMALLHYYCRLGRNIARLEWNQQPTIRDRRLIDVLDLKTTAGAYINSMEQFLLALAEGLWTDRFECSCVGRADDPELEQLAELSKPLHDIRLPKANHAQNL